MTEPIAVTLEENGQKLLSFLSRRFDTTPAVLHRWIRTGQIRINGRRCKPFERVQAGDLIRVPPFAAEDRKQTPVLAASFVMPAVLYEDDEMMLLFKPVGIPVHPGSGTQADIASFLASQYSDAPFRPTPAHRLDRDTSGLLLVAKTYGALRRFSDLFALHQGIVKIYLAWIAGVWPYDSVRTMTHYLEKKEDAYGRERVISGSGGKQASLRVQCLLHTRTMSLMRITLLTGRTHQIRVQMSAEGFPLMGDVKYGGPKVADGLKLHAFALKIGDKQYTALPGWSGDFAIPASIADSLLKKPF
ncbi:MAG: RluA family pseudouridine synthase [Desulfovibrionaceae bacterium]|nr:RluA family pseudouridine synthase [Desulfovibrionaceae bacterium]